MRGVGAGVGMGEIRQGTRASKPVARGEDEGTPLYGGRSYHSAMHAPARSRLGLLWLCAAGWAAGTIGGCANPDDAVGFQEKDPAARLRAIRRATSEQDHAAIPDLIRALESDDPAERLFAFRGLEKLTGQTLGYDHAASREDRTQAAKRWAEWYSHAAESTKKEGGSGA